MVLLRRRNYNYPSAAVLLYDGEFIAKTKGEKTPITRQLGADIEMKSPAQDIDDHILAEIGQRQRPIQLFTYKRSPLVS